MRVFGVTRVTAAVKERRFEKQPRLEAGYSPGVNVDVSDAAWAAIQPLI